MGGLVIDVVSLSRLLSSCQFNFIRREANAIAHFLAKWAKDNERYISWVGSLPNKCCIFVS